MMANGNDKADRTVDLQPFGNGGSVHYGSTRGVFGGLTLTDELHIVWKSALPAGADVGRMHKAAEEAVRDALRQRGL